MKARAQAMAAATLPQVNLLPPEVRAARGLKVVKRWLAVAVAFSLLLGAGLVGLAVLAQRAADGELRDAQADADRLMTEQEKYAEVPVVLRQLDSIKLAREVGMSTEVLWSGYLSAIAATAPAGVSIENFIVSSTTPMMLPTAPVNPLQALSAGTITFTADSLTNPDTEAWLDGLETIPGFADAWFSGSTITEADGTAFYTVSATVQFNEQAFAGRFAPTEEEG